MRTGVWEDVPADETAVSQVAANPTVREVLVERQRAWVAARDGGVVEGRDITTVVAPDAPVRILLTAAPEVRAARRSAEVTTQDAAAVAAALHQRDASDSTVVDFLTAAPGVEVVDSTHLDFDQTVDAVLGVIQAAPPSSAAAGTPAADPLQTGARDGR